jgi:hypothetical protein
MLICLLIFQFQCTNISFWYIPPRLRGKEETPEWWAEVHKVLEFFYNLYKENAFSIIERKVNN